MADKRKNLPAPTFSDPAARQLYQEMISRKDRGEGVGGMAIWMDRYEVSKKLTPAQEPEVGVPSGEYLEAARSGLIDLGTNEQLSTQVSRDEKVSRLYKDLPRIGGRREFFNRLLSEKERFPEQWDATDEANLERLSERFDDERSDGNVIEDGLSETSGNRTMRQAIGNLLGIGRN